MPLHDLVGLRQTDSASAFLALGRVVELEDFFLRFGRNATALVAHLGENRFAFAPRFFDEVIVQCKVSSYVWTITYCIV